jgi:quercetin dioxygenase-like cupin family protein
MTFFRSTRFAAAALAIGAAAFVTGYATAHSGSEGVKQVFHTALPNVPGKALSAVVVDYAPGAKSGAHHHSGSVFAFVLSGAVRSEVAPGGPAKVYKAGEFFFEKPGDSHLVSENASETKPASLLAVFVADEGAVLTEPGPAQ